MRSIPLTCGALDAGAMWIERVKTYLHKTGAHQQDVFDAFMLMVQLEILIEAERGVAHVRELR